MGQPIASNTAPNIVNNDDDEEWEFEYDATETEDLYFTLDLTSHVPDAVQQRPAPTNGKHESNGAVRGSPSHEENDDGDEETVNEDVGNLQIVDLHTTNPLIKFDDQIFSCYWSTDLGTQVHIAQAGEVPNPRRAGTVLDVVGTTRSRLVGKPAYLRPRKDDRQPQEGQAANNAIEIDDGSDSDYQPGEDRKGSTPGQTPGQLLEIPQEMLTSKNEREQAAFFEKLSQIKLQKGELDTIPIYPVRTYNPPDNIEEIRQKDIEAQAAKAQKAKDEILAAKGDRPRKRRRRFIDEERGPQRYGGRKSREDIATSLGLRSSDPVSEGQAREGAGTSADEEDEDAEGIDEDEND